MTDGLLQEQRQSELFYEWGFAALRRGMLIIFISMIFTILSLIIDFISAIAGLRESYTSLISNIFSIIGTILMVIGGYGVYTGLEDLARIEPTFNPARTGALLLVIGTLALLVGGWIPIFFIIGWIGLLAFIGGAVLFMYGLWVIGEDDLSGRIHKGILLIIIGIILLIVIIGILLIAWGVWDIYRGLESVEERYKAVRS